MRNPVRTEAEAFSFVIAVLALFVAVARRRDLPERLGGARRVRRPRADHRLPLLPQRPEGRRARGLGPRAATRTAATGSSSSPTRPSPAARSAGEVVRRAQEGDAEVLVVTPALNTRIRHWTSDEDTARTAAQIRLDESLAALSKDGVDARGTVGDDDPIQAIEDSLRMFACRRDRRLDAPARPLELARARDRRARAASASTSRSRTSSSTSKPRPRRAEPPNAARRLGGP